MLSLKVPLLSVSLHHGFLNLLPEVSNILKRSLGFLVRVYRISRLKEKFETKSNILMDLLKLHQVVQNRKVVMQSQVKDCKWLLVPL